MPYKYIREHLHVVLPGSGLVVTKVEGAVASGGVEV